MTVSAATLDARPGPRIGDGTDRILREIGGYSDAQVAEVRAAYAIGPSRPPAQKAVIRRIAPGTG